MSKTISLVNYDFNAMSPQHYPTAITKKSPFQINKSPTQALKNKLNKRSLYPINDYKNNTLQQQQQQIELRNQAMPVKKIATAADKTQSLRIFQKLPKTTEGRNPVEALLQPTNLPVVKKRGYVVLDETSFIN